MDLSLSPSSIPISTPIKSRAYTLYPNLPNFNSKSRNFLWKPLTSRQIRPIRAQTSNGATPNDGFVLEDVPHLTDFLPALPVPLPSNSHCSTKKRSHKLLFLIHVLFILFCPVVSESTAKQQSLCDCQVYICVLICIS